MNTEQILRVMECLNGILLFGFLFLVLPIAWVCITEVDLKRTYTSWVVLGLYLLILLSAAVGRIYGYVAWGY